MDLETVIAAGEKAFVASMAVMKMKMKTKDETLIGQALWEAFRTARIEPKTSEAWNLMARVPFSDQDALRLFTYLAAENKYVAADGWADGLDGLVRQVDDIEPLRTLARSLPAGAARGMLLNLDRLTVRFDEAAFRQAVEHAPLPDWSRVVELLAFEGAPTDAGAQIFADAGWFQLDLPVGLKGLPHALDALRTFRELDFEATTSATGGACSVPLPASPADAALAAQLVAEWPQGADQPEERVGPPDYRALTAVATRLHDDADGVGDSDHEWVFPPLPPGATVQLPHPNEYVAYYAEHRGGTTLVWRGGEGEGEEAPALIARGMGAFLRYTTDRVPENEPPEPVLASQVDAGDDTGLQAWLTALPLGSLVLDLRDATLPVLIAGMPSMDKPVACGQVVLYAIGSRSEAIDGLLRRVAAYKTTEAAAQGFGLHPVAMTGRLRWCHTEHAPVIEAMPRTAEAHAEWLKAKEAENLRAFQAYEKARWLPMPLPLDEVPALTPSFLARYG